MGRPTKNGLERSELSRFAEKAGISPTYAYEILMGKKQPNLMRAAAIYSRTKRKYGPLSKASNRDCAAVVRVMRDAGLLEANDFGFTKAA